MADTTLRLKLDGKVYEIDGDPKLFSAAETNAVERHTGMTVGEWADKLRDRRVSTLAWTALAFVAKKRAGENPRWEDVEEDLKVLELLSAFNGSEPAPSPAEPVKSAVAEARKAKRKASVKVA